MIDKKLPNLTEAAGDVRQKNGAGGIPKRHRALFASCQTPVAAASQLRVFSSLPTEQEGFEPPVPFSTTVFKTVAISRSATAPVRNILRGMDFFASKFGFLKNSSLLFKAFMDYQL